MTAPGPDAGHLPGADRDRDVPLARALGTLVAVPVAVLVLLLALPVPFALAGVLDYTSVVPTILFMGGIVVLFVGAWWDFGARKYVATLLAHHLPFGETDLVLVHRRQFHLMLLYFALGSLYLATAFGIAALGGPSG